MQLDSSLDFFPNFFWEKKYQNLIVAGCDEAGRGPLAGPVVAACAILNQDDFPTGIHDSKKLGKKQRLKLFSELKNKAKFGVGIVDEKTIDRINILEASKLAMLYAMKDLQQKYQTFVQIILVDGNFFPFEKQDEIREIIPIVKGDSKSLSIAAASIIAKEIRDEIMQNFHQKFPLYGFDRHAGYPTKFHREKIIEHGICEIHRKSFKPIKELICENS